MKEKPVNREHAALIELLGGSVALAKVCEVTHSAVSQWKKSGIPKPWMMLFRERFPEHFDMDGRVIKSPHPAESA